MTIEEIDLRSQRFEDRVEHVRAIQLREIGRRNLWLAHHWPHDYRVRCVRIGGRPVCRRCAALYPLAFLVAVVSALGAAPWPPSIDPAPIWLLSIPATIAYAGEAIGLFGYSPRWQVATTLVAAMAFGRGLGYELVERWSPEFWQPLTFFGSIWFTATVVGWARRAGEADRGAATEE